MQVNEVTGHGFSSHSRRPMDCRVCKLPAARHGQAEVSEAHSVSMWKAARHPLVTDRIQGYSDRTLNVLRHIADLGGKFDAWDRSSRGWHKTAVSILEKDGIFTRVNDGEAPGRYALTEAGVQACSWHGFDVTQDEPLDIPTGAEMSEIIAEHDAAMDAWAAPLLTAIAPARVEEQEAPAPFTARWGDAAKAGKVWTSSGTLVDPIGAVPTAEQIDARDLAPMRARLAAEADDIARSEDNGCAEDIDTMIEARDEAMMSQVAPQPGDTVYRDRDGAQGEVIGTLLSGELDILLTDVSAVIRTVGELTEEGFEVIPAAEVPSESEVWAGTGTVIERTPRVSSFRKVKDTRSARRRRGGRGGK